MISKLFGVDPQQIMMTMLGLVAIYLIVTRASQVNSIVKTLAGGWNEGLVILQGRNPKGTLR